MDNWSVYKLFPLLVLVTVGVDNSGEHVLNNHSLNLGATITKLAVSDKYVYVGGVNFVAQLTKSLDVVLFNLTIGPVLKDEDCRPQTGPCDNQVMVMEIDANLRRLVVCGTAYRGTCTLHSLSDITDWRCLYGDNGADILTGDVTQKTFLQISSKSPVNESLISLNYKNFTCNKYNNVEQPLSKVKKSTSFYPTNSLSSSIIYFSYLDKNTGSITTSIRQVDFINQQYVIKFVNQAVVKFTQEKTIVYMSSFFWEDNSYIISSQIQHGYNVTVLSRVDKNMNVSNTVLECKHNSTSYHEIKSASLLQWGPKTPPVVMVILGSYNSEGFVMCGFSLDKINPVSPSPQVTTRDPQHYPHTENKIIGQLLFHFKFDVREFEAFVGSGNLSPTDVVMVTQESELHRIVLANQDLCPLHSTSWDCKDRGCKWCHTLGACMIKNKDRTTCSILRNKRAISGKPSSASAEDEKLNCTRGSGGTLNEIKFEIHHQYSPGYKFYVGNDSCIRTRKLLGNKTECIILRKPITEKTSVPVKVQVNNQTLYCQDNFTFQPDPKFERIEPKAAILSGGTYITIFGTNLEETDTKAPVINITVNGTPVPADLSKWSAPKDRNNKIQWRTLKSPNLKTINITEDMILSGKSNLSITWAHVKKIEDLKIYPDPELFNQGLTITANNDSNSVLVIQGRNIPTWLNKNEIQVYVGKISCNVLDTTESTITCNATSVVNNIENSCSTSSPNQTFVNGTTTPGTHPNAGNNNQKGWKANKEIYYCSQLGLNLTTSNEGAELSGLSADVTVEIGNFKKILPKVKFVFTQIIVEDNSITVIIISVAMIVAVVVLALVVYLRISRLKAKKYASMNDREEGKLSLAKILESTVEPNKRADIDKLIIKLDRLTLGKTIGEGNFGCVFEGFLVTGKGSVGVKVAVKTLQESVSQSMDLKGFVQEAVMMREFQHPNVLGLVGLSEKEPGVPYVVLPFMENGDLLTYVRDPDVQLTLHDVIKFGADIADGMAYLSSLKFVHRDLAARNCMLDSVHRVKVADFGLCRDIYEKGYYTSDNKKQLPIRWMAIESIEHGAYSTKSDVWSLGVVLWEMLTRGVTPYPGVDGWDIINFLRRRRLPAPFFCPDELYCLMMQCWAKDPNLRPTFKALHLELQLLIGQDSLLPSTPKINKKNPEKCPDLQTSNLQSSKTPGASKTETKSEIPKGIPETIVEANGEMTKVHYENTASCMGERTLTVPAMNALPDVTITIPECYSDREVSGTTVKKFHRLVDNYETAPDFKKKTNKPTKKTSFTSVNRNSSLLERLTPGNGGVCEGGGVALTQDSAYFMLEKATDDDSCAADSALQRTQSLMEGSNRARVSTNRLSLTVSNIYV